MSKIISTPLHIENIARNDVRVFYGKNAFDLVNTLFDRDLCILNDTKGGEIKYQLIERRAAAILIEDAGRQPIPSNTPFTLPFDGEIYVHKSVMAYLSSKLEKWNEWPESMLDLLRSTKQVATHLLEFLQTHDNPDSAYAGVIHW